MANAKATIWMMTIVLLMNISLAPGVIHFADGQIHNIDYEIDDTVWVDRDAPGLQTTVNLLVGGSIGQDLEAYEDCQINILGGSIERLSAYDSSLVNMYDGWIGNQISAFETSQVSISGGLIRYSLNANNDATITVFGWDFVVDGDAFGYGELRSIYGGSVWDDLRRRLNGILASRDKINNNMFRIGYNAKIILRMPEELLIAIDIKPGSCPNPLNVKDRGLLPVAILGSEDFDVFNIDPDSIRLERITPIHISYEDVSTPVSDSEDDCACTTEGPDGYLDMTLKLNTEEIIGALGQVNDGDLVLLTLTGRDIYNVSLTGMDCVVIIDKTKPLITSVVRDGVTEGQPTIVARGLREGSKAYMDRPLDEFDSRNYHWESIPAELVRADYVLTYNEDKNPKYDYAYNVSYSVTLSEAANLYIFVDQNYVPFAWLTDGSSGAVFTDTGLEIILNELGGSNELRPFDVYKAEVVTGKTYILGASCDGSGERNFYGIAATKL